MTIMWVFLVIFIVVFLLMVLGFWIALREILEIRGMLSRLSFSQDSIIKKLRSLELLVVAAHSDIKKNLNISE